MKKLLSLLLLLWLTSTCLAGALPRGLRQPQPESFPQLYQFTDTCNVYVLKHDTDALLINLGDGQIFDLLPKIGIQRVDMILLNNHHRENLQGYSRVDPRIMKITASPMRAEIVPLEIELDGKQYGQWFDFMVGKEPAK